MKWLRVKHNIDIEIDADVGMLGVKVYTPFISTYKSVTDNTNKLRQYKRGLHYKDDKGVVPALQHFPTYKEAVEAIEANLADCIPHIKDNIAQKSKHTP